jgi:hypothetical protein
MIIPKAPLGYEVDLVAAMVCFPGFFMQCFYMQSVNAMESTHLTNT